MATHSGIYNLEKTCLWSQIFPSQNSTYSETSDKVQEDPPTACHLSLLVSSSPIFPVTAPITFREEEELGWPAQSITEINGSRMGNDTTTFLSTRKQIPFSCFISSIPLAALTQFQVFVVFLCLVLRLNYVVWLCSLLHRLKNSTSRSEEIVKYVNLGQLHGLYIAVCLQIRSLIWYHVIQASIKKEGLYCRCTSLLSRQRPKDLNLSLPSTYSPGNMNLSKPIILHIIKLIISKMVLALAPKCKTWIDKGSERSMPQENTTPHK